MMLLTLPDGERQVYSESFAHGHFIEDPQQIRRCERTYDVLRADALSVRESADLIRTLMKGFRNMSPTTRDLSAASWRKSSYSGGDGGNCLEVADGFPGLVPVRDSKDPHGPALAFPAEAWRAFVAGVKAGEFPVSA